MTVLGMPLEMFLIFVGTIVAGSLGAVHYVVVHVIMGKPMKGRVPDRAESSETSLIEESEG